MATNGTAIASCTAPQSIDSPQSPFYSLNYHFGMLLGVADFETEQAYHRGKMRLHNQWLHREGVAWGMGVSTDLTTQEIRVAPGLAIDAAGRELFLEQDACVNVPAWFAKHRTDTGFVFTEDAARIVFDAHVAIRFKACLSRQVPALSEPCEAAGTSTAYSRVFETLEIFLLPGLSVVTPRPYHRLRLWFGLDAPVMEAGAIVPADREVLEAPRTLEAFRRFAALDAIDLRPLAANADTSLVLADLTGITLDKLADGALRLSAGAVNSAVRAVVLATTAIQELLMGDAGTAGGGPSILPGSVRIDEPGTRIELRANADLQAASIQPDAFLLSTFDQTAGWSGVVVSSAAYDNASRTITLRYTGPLTGQLVRLAARGSGAQPILGANFAPLGNGKDFVHSQRRS